MYSYLWLNPRKPKTSQISCLGWWHHLPVGLFLFQVLGGSSLGPHQSTVLWAPANFWLFLWAPSLDEGECTKSPDSERPGLSSWTMSWVDPSVAQSCSLELEGCAQWDPACSWLGFSAPIPRTRPVYFCFRGEDYSESPHPPFLRKVDIILLMSLCLHLLWSLWGLLFVQFKLWFS